MKTKMVSFIAWASALIAFFVSTAASARDLFFEISVTPEGQRSTAYVWGSKHVPMIEHSIKNASLVPVTLTRIWLNRSWTVDDVFIEDGDRLIQATHFDPERGRVGVSVDYTLAPNEVHRIRVRASLPSRLGRGMYEARVDFAGLEVSDDRDSRTYTYTDWFVPGHALVDKLPGPTVVSNSSTRGRVQDGGSHGFVVTGDRFMKTRVLVRLAGPALAEFGVRDALADPVVRVLNSKGELVAGADDWIIDLEDSFRKVGAFPFRRGSLDSAVLADLLPGVYTVEVKSFGTTPQTGSYLIETYQTSEETSAATVIVPPGLPRPSEKG